MVGDPSFKDEARQLMTVDTIESNIASIKRVFSNYLTYGDGPEGRADDQQCRMAALAQLPRIPARCRPAFLGQPHAVLRQRQDAPRSRAVAVLPRIQLHDPAGLRFRRACQALRLPPADGRFGPVGQYRQRHRSRSPHGDAAALRADLAAADDLLRRQDGQVGYRRGLAECRHAVGL